MTPENTAGPEGRGFPAATGSSSESTESTESEYHAYHKRRSPSAALLMAAAMGGGLMNQFRLNRRKSSFEIRHDPEREKTEKDLARIEAARQKRERRKARKYPTNVKGDS